ncbi:hypothetical protein [Luteolibacter luteus]|uniref:Uncharacterized protein n=1 Tax=Luteolibacter luteus TaxID=2728835 RepID=A0A858RPW8_9BACT|nr:hypothetical protein [Luteolibacter luteus]QJE98775.1 hypothetical protein HHL09_24340 [Luteolibacter luteus]
MEENPYEAPAIVDVEAPAATDAEAIRLKHLAHEASLKTLGLICYLIGFLGCYNLAVTYYVVWYSGSDLPEMSYSVAQIVVWILPIPFQFLVGYGLRRLLPWVRIPAGILFAVSLLRVPIGTVVGIWGLYLVLSTKGRTVLSPAYREIISQTPDLRYRRGPAVRLLFWILVVALLTLIFFAFFG